MTHFDIMSFITLFGDYNFLISNILKVLSNIGYCNAERYKCPPNEQYKY